VNVSAAMHRLQRLGAMRRNLISRQAFSPLRAPLAAFYGALLETRHWSRVAVFCSPSSMRTRNSWPGAMAFAGVRTLDLPRCRLMARSIEARTPEARREASSNAQAIPLARQCERTRARAPARVVDHGRARLARWNRPPRGARSCFERVVQRPPLDRDSRVAERVPHDRRPSALQRPLNTQAPISSYEDLISGLVDGARAAALVFQREHPRVQASVTEFVRKLEKRLAEDRREGFFLGIVEDGWSTTDACCSDRR
jgi:hypothetical protein